MVAWRAILLAAMDESQRPLGPKAMPPWREKNPEGLRIGTGGSGQPKRFPSGGGSWGLVELNEPYLIEALFRGYRKTGKFFGQTDKFGYIQTSYRVVIPCFSSLSYMEQRNLIWVSG